MNCVNLCGLRFKGLNKKEILNQKDFTFIVTANAEFIVKAQNNRRFRSIINDNQTTFDGTIPYWLGKSKTNHGNIEKISGSDLIYDICSQAKEKKKRVFLLGGLEESNSDSVLKLKQAYQIEIAGYSPPFEDYPFCKETNELIKAELLKFMPDYLMVGFGAVKQEYWIEDNRDFLMAQNIRIAVGTGGTFEFVSGKINRAPSWIQKIGMESIFRFFQEPSLFRLKRILLSFLIIKFYFMPKALENDSKTVLN